MYANYFGFQQIPFDSEIKAEDFFYCSSARHASEHLVEALRNLQNLTFLSGEKGTGKTSLMRHVIACNTDANVKFVFPQSHIDNFEQILELLWSSVGWRKSDFHKHSTAEKCSQLSQFLADRSGEQFNWVLILEDVDNIPVDVVRDIIAFSKRCDGTGCILKLLFTGTPSSLSSLFEHQYLANYRDMVGARVTLGDFQKEEIEWFIDHRLKLAGYEGIPLFTSQAIESIAKHTQGNPALINVLCGLSLLNVSIEDRQQVTSEIVDDEARHCIFQREENNENTCESVGDANLSTDTAHKLNEDSANNLVADIFDDSTVLCSPPIEIDNAKIPGDKADICDNSQDLENRYKELGLPLPDFQTDTPEVFARRESDQTQTSRIRLPIFQSKLVYAAVSGLLLLGLSGVFLENIESMSILSQIKKEKLETPKVTNHFEPTKVRQLQSEPEVLTKEEKPLSDTAANDQDSQIQSMLERAKGQIVSNRLIGGNGDSALDTYKEISKLVNKQLETLNDLIHIKKLYRRWGLEAEIQQQWSQAEIFYGHALKISPDDKDLSTAMQRVQSHLVAG